MTLVIGTSGWQYADWRDRLYHGVPQRNWLGHYAARFATVEVNNAFYRLPERTTFEAWRHRTPGDFVIAVKASRYLTHIKRLRDPAEPVARFLDRAQGLGPRLGPVLLQLPPTLPADAGLLTATLDQFPAGIRVAVEPRHESWWTGAVRATLEEHGAALCWADRGSRPVTPLWRTADYGYVRLHEGRARPHPRYGQAALRSWIRRITSGYEAGAPVFVYFNNDPGGAAVLDAMAFAGAATSLDVPVTRVPQGPDFVAPDPA